MERQVGIEQARGRLGKLADEVASNGDPVVLAKRGQSLAVLVSNDEYAEFKRASTEAARAELQERLVEIQRRVKEAGLEPGVVDEAIAAARRLA